MSGVLHCEKVGCNTAHSYFLEAFEQLDKMEDRERAKACLDYMMLCKVLDAVVKALKVSSGGGVGEFRHGVFVVCYDVLGILSFANGLGLRCKCAVQNSTPSLSQTIFSLSPHTHTYTSTRRKIVQI